MRPDSQKSRKTSDYIAEKLGLGEGEVELYIEADYKEWYNQANELKMKLADSVQYYHPKTKTIIIIGPRNISAGERIVNDAGYESEDFGKFFGRGDANN